MKNELKSIFLMGIGAERVTRKKAEKVINAFERKKVITSREAKEIVSHILSKAGNIKEKLSKEGKQEIRSAKRKVVSIGKSAKRKAGRAIRNATKKALRKSMRL